MGEIFCPFCCVTGILGDAWPMLQSQGGFCAHDGIFGFRILSFPQMTFTELIEFDESTQNSNEVFVLL